jgi:hypothetical protein
MWLLFPESSPDGDPSGKTYAFWAKNQLSTLSRGVVPAISDFAHMRELKLK